MSEITKIQEKARAICPKIVFPEPDETRILEVAEQTVKKGFARPVLVGSKEAIEEKAAQEGISLEGIEIVEITDEKKQQYTQAIVEDYPDFTEKMVMRKLRDPLYFASCMVHLGEAESFIAGYKYTTGEVILAAATYVGLREGIQKVSSFNIVTIPGFEGSEGETVIFTDVAVCVSPDSETLANIGILSADAAKSLLNWEPRVAFLSFSTKGSGEGADADKVIDAVRIIHEKRPDICADGEFQLEVALSMKAAEKKLEEIGPVAGRANIIVFPDLDAGNTNIKSVKLFSNADSIGPVLTGFKKPVSDLSRTGSLEHLMNTVAAVAAMCSKGE